MRAEKDRLERMNDKNLFEKYLPYAIALGVSDRWAESFEGIYQEPPEWYVSPGGIGSFRPASFNRSLGTALSSMSSAMYASPRSGGKRVLGRRELRAAEAAAGAGEAGEAASDPDLLPAPQEADVVAPQRHGSPPRSPARTAASGA